MRELSRRRGLAFGVAFALSSFAACAQTVLPGSAGATARQPIGEAKEGYTIDRGMPYSGTWVTKHLTQLPHGQVARDESTRKVWRDSDGRTREETTWTRWNGVVATVCRIEDPVARVRYIWRIEPDTETVVTETHFTMDKYVVSEIWPNASLRPAGDTPGVTVVVLDPSEHHSHSRGIDLGRALINGVNADGIRYLEPVASNPARHRIDEFWWAPELNLVIKTYLNDGNGLIEDSQLKHIKRSEPDPSVFRPPSDLPSREAPASDPVWHESYGSD